MTISQRCGNIQHNGTENRPKTTKFGGKHHENN
nr:MAG TPA_asm: hypothetical protein [Caudoviricetes sp.]DAO58456.1 MAG TPA: hypothetical protein [Caudoviricetes sp.]DAV15754.1 MAG TPA: hypothetical protein [Caudoviricetes sp.]